MIYLQPTTPFRTFLDINKGLNKILRAKTTSLVGVVKVTEHPYWMFEKEENNKLTEFVRKHNKPLRRQDLPKLYYINDALFISKTEYYENASLNSPVFNKNDVTGLEMDYFSSFDINTELDFKIAECLLKGLAYE